jgi:uncharacterized peroxidase-related enzyme
MEHSSRAQGIPVVHEADATGEVARLYDEVKQFMQIPFVPNMSKALATSPAALTIHWMLTRTFYEQTTLPKALSSMIFYTIAATSNCAYCTAGQELQCRTLGIDDETLTALVEDIGSVSPQRIGAIIEFALKTAKHPQSITEADYEGLRRHGITDGEIVEIVQVAAAGVYLDILADALKIEVEGPTHQALANLRES